MTVQVKLICEKQFKTFIKMNTLIKYEVYEPIIKFTKYINNLLRNYSIQNNK